MSEINFSKKGISIIICCHNSTSRIEDTLSHLAQQDAKAFFHEIILVDNNSTDDTKIAAKKTWKNLNPDIPLKIIDEKKQGLIYAKRTGVNNATYDLILFCDDDNWLNPNYLSIAIDYFKKNNDVVLIGGKGDPTFEKDFTPPQWFKHASKYHYAIHTPSLESNNQSYDHIYGAGSVIRKNILKLIEENYSLILSGRKGEKIISGEDIELSYVLKILGFRIMFLEELNFLHYLPKSKINKKWIQNKMNDSYSQFIIGIYKDVYEEKNTNILNYYLSILIKIVVIILACIKKTILFNWDTYSRLWLSSQLKLTTFKLMNHKNYKEKKKHILQLKSIKKRFIEPI